jgi:predicted F0F1-ATPase subunit
MADGSRTKIMKRKDGMKHSWAAFVKVGLFILIPTIAGVLAGIRLDTADTSFWTVLLTIIGFLIGCSLAWYSIRVEMRHQGEIYK